MAGTLHMHVTSWLLALVLFVVAQVLHQRGKEKEPKNRQNDFEIILFAHYRHRNHAPQLSCRNQSGLYRENRFRFARHYFFRVDSRQGQ